MATTQRKPARAPRKPAHGRQTANRTGPTKPNLFDDIARHVNAEQEAKDRAAGRDDLIPTPAKPVGQAKAERPPTRPTKAARSAKPTKVQGNRTTFAGRPVSDPAKVAARAREVGLRVRADVDVDAIATRLRATPDAVSAWLATRIGGPTKTPAKTTSRQPTKAKADAKLTQVKPNKVPSITLGHLWGDKKPDWLYRCTLVTRYEVRPDGTVWSTLHQVLGPDGNVLEDFWKLPLDYRTHQEVQGNGRRVSLRNRSIAGLQSWLIRKGLTSPERHHDVGGRQLDTLVLLRQPREKAMPESRTGPSHIVDQRTVEVRRTQRANGTVSYDGDHNGVRWRLSYRANGQTRLHFPGGRMRVVKTWYGRNKGQDWTNIDMEPEKR